MSDISVKNNTHLPIHIAMTWKGIVQYYRNDLPPGEMHNFDQFGTGWSDFTAVIGTDENKFNHDSDAAAILGLAAVVGGIAMGIAGLVLIPFTAGTSATATVIGISVAISAGTVSLAGAVIEGVEGVLMPASVKALFVSDRYSLKVNGGNVIGTHDSETNTFTVSKIEPLVINWENKTAGTKGEETAPSS